MPVLYIGRTVLKGYNRNMLAEEVYKRVGKRKVIKLFQLSSLCLFFRTSMCKK
jgi:hypothetical protein